MKRARCAVVVAAMLCSVALAKYKGEKIAPHWFVNLGSGFVGYGAGQSTEFRAGEFICFIGPVGLGASAYSMLNYHGLSFWPKAVFAPTVYLVPSAWSFGSGLAAPYVRAGVCMTADNLFDVTGGIVLNPTMVASLALNVGVRGYKEPWGETKTNSRVGIEGSLGYWSYRRTLPPPALIGQVEAKSLPNSVLPGDGFQVSVMLENKGKGPAAGLTAQVEMVSQSLAGYMSLPAVEMPRIEPGRLESFVVPARVSLDAPVATFDLRVVCRDRKGKEYFRSDEFTVRVGHEEPKPETVAARPPSRPQSPAPSPQPPAPAPSVQLPSRSNVFALVVGAGEHESKGISKLEYADIDAQALRDMLTSSSQGGLPAENVRLLSGRDATISQIRKGLSWLVNQVRATNGLALLYFSGHGAPAQGASGEFKQAYLVPYDCDPDYLEETAIPVSDIEAKLAELNGRAFVALDACFSGKGRSFVKPGAKGVTLVPRNLGLKQEGKGVTFMTASKADQISTEYDAGKHGLFTYYLLDGLSGKADEAGNKDGWVDAAETYAYVRDKVNAEARKLNVEQDPELIGSAAGLNLTVNYDRFLKSSKEAKMAKVKAAYEVKLATADQLSRAIREIESGQESMSLKDFLEGRIPADVFGRIY